jgi:hypothetical protein
LKRIRKREYPEALLCDVFFYDTVKEAERVEGEIARLAKELKKSAIEMDLYDHRHAAGIDLMRKIYEHLSMKASPAQRFKSMRTPQRGLFS